MRTGARILNLLAGLLAGEDDVGEPVARILQRAWSPQDPAITRLLDAALILCADHELNTSTFTARVVASTGANLYLVVQAGLAALQGHKHGGHMLLVEEWLHLVATPDRVRLMIAARLQRGECVPGFYPHLLYPAGDPRGKLLMRLIEEQFPAHPAVRLAQEVAATMATISQKAPTIDFALVVLCQALDLPSGTSVALFALGRMVGWVAHALEQQQTGTLIRPRATYVGP